MIEVSVTETYDLSGQRMSRTIGAIRVDEKDPTAEPEILQPLDGRSLAVVMKVLRTMAHDQARAREEFGDPAGDGG
jgi:hypothetical protein